MKIFVISICTCILLFGCKKRSQDQENTDLTFISQNKIVTIDKMAFDDARFIDSCVFIPLETSDLGLIGEITQIETFLDRYYIYDKKTKKLKVFNSNGKYLFDIGKEGEGPGEYQGICSFYINEKENKIGIFDPLKMAVHEYNLNGDFLQTIKHNQILLTSIKKPLYFDKHIYCFFPVSYISDMIYSLISAKDYKIIDRWSTYPVKVDEQMFAEIMYHPFSLINDELHYITLFSDTIYSYIDSVKKPYLLIETGKPNIPSEYFKGKLFEHNPTDAFMEVWKDKKYSPGFTELFETDRYILVNFRLNHDFYIIDKDKMEVFHVLEPEEFYLNFMKSSSVSNNKLIKALNIEDISYYQNNIVNSKSEYPKQIRELMSNFDTDNDNPIIIIYYMKKSTK